LADFGGIDVVSGNLMGAAIYSAMAGRCRLLSRADAALWAGVMDVVSEPPHVISAQSR
jgi:hypothetical protein